jgi:hypothetical protein
LIQIAFVYLLFILFAYIDFVLSQKTTLLSGWGSYTLDENATFPSVLQKTSDLQILTEEECAKRQKDYLNLKGNESTLSGKYRGVFDQGICARGKSEKVEAGYGDSGGPLVALAHEKDGQSSIIIPTLVGVVSHMRAELDWKTNATFHLDYFAKVSSFKKWILE